MKSRRKKKPSDAEEFKATAMRTMANARATLGKVNAPYTFVKAAFARAGSAVAAVLSVGRASANDARVVSDQLAALVAVAISVWITYNWFFLLVWRPGGLEVGRIDPRDLGHFLLTAAFRYITVPLAVTQSAIHDNLGPVFVWVGTALSRHIAMMAMFTFVIMMTNRMGDSIVRAFFNALQCKYDWYMGTWAMFMVGYALYITFHVPVNIPVVGPYINPVVDFANAVALAMTPGGMLVPTIRFLIRFAYSMTIGFLSSLLVMGYVIVMSLFAIPIYNRASTSVGGALTEMHDFVMNKREAGDCGESRITKILRAMSVEHYIQSSPDFVKKTMKYRMVEAAYWCSVYVYVFMVEIAFVICLASSARVYATKIKHTGLSTTLVVLTCMCIMALVMKVGVGMYVAGRDPGSAIALARAAMAAGPGAEGAGAGAGVPAAAPTNQPLTASGARSALQSAMATMTSIKVPTSIGEAATMVSGAAVTPMPIMAVAPATGEAPPASAPVTPVNIVSVPQPASAPVTSANVAAVSQPGAMAAAAGPAMSMLSSLFSKGAPSAIPVSAKQ
jgi:hypothetical protein